MEKSILFYLLQSSIPCHVLQMYKELTVCYTRKILRSPSTASSKLKKYANEEDEINSHHKKSEMRNLMGVNFIDVNLVMRSIGLEGWRRDARISDENSENNQVSEVVYELLEDKNASLVELKEAFYVFDHDEDGFITAFELWSVLRRLGFKEGMKYGDCEKMIRVFDQDGDDMINFQEFKNMMENST